MNNSKSILVLLALTLSLQGCPGSGGGGSGGTFSITTTTAPFGVVGNNYSTTLATSGGTAPFTWTLFGGTLPNGTTLNATTGAVAGNTSAQGNFNPTFAVTDSTGKTATGSVLFAIHPRTDRVSVNSSGTAGNGVSTEPVINSNDGRFIAFSSLATNLTALPGGSGSQIFVHDRQTGLPSLISRDNLSNAGNGASSQPTISADGRFVAFTSAANLVPAPGGSGTQIFLRDTQTNQTILISRDTLGNAGNGASNQPTISADGRFIAFTSAATNLASVIGGSGTQIFLRDTQTNQTILVSQTGGNAGNGASSQPTISATTGQFVAFTSLATNLAAIPGGSGSQIFLRDTVGNATTLVSRDTAGNAGNGASSEATISANGQFVAFTSLATNLAAIPGGSGSQIFLRDTSGNQTNLVSKDNSTPANAGNGASSAPAIVGNGGFVAFTSQASNLVLGGVALSDIYVRALP